MEIRLGPVVIHGQAAAHVQRAQRRALLHQVHVNAGGLRQPLAHHGNIRNLGTLVVMEQLQAIQRIHLLQLIHHVHHLGRVQAEDGLVPRGLLPQAGPLGRQLDAHAQIGADVHPPGAFQNHVQLGRHFQHNENIQPHLLGRQRQVNEFVILVPVADQVGIRIVHVGHGGNQLRLGTGLQTVIILGAELRDLLHHLPLLVHLDGVDTLVLALVIRFLDRLPEAVVQLRNAAAQQVPETEQHGNGGAALLQAFQQVAQADILFPAVLVVQAYGHFPFLVDPEITVPPVVNAVQICGIMMTPTPDFLFDAFFSCCHVNLSGQMF